MDFLKSLVSTGDKKRKYEEYVTDDVDESKYNYDNLPACLTEDIPQTPREINYGSYFFRKDIMDNFNIGIKTLSPNTLLNRYKLYNGDDLINLISLCPGSYTRGMETTERFSIYKNTFLNTIKQELALLCTDIAELYGKNSIIQSLGGDIMKYDIAVLADPTIMEDTRLHTVKVDDPTQGEKWFKRKKRMMSFEEFSKYKLDSIIGFIIVEKNMCVKYSDAYGINLICSRSGVEPGIGSLLMGLYLYTIVSHPKSLPSSKTTSLTTYPSGKATIRYELIGNEDEVSSQVPVFTTNDVLIPVQHVGILELAGGYKNVPGLCLYEKFGFKYDPLLLKKNCFSDVENLQMILLFNSNKKYKSFWKSNIEKIKQILLKISVGYKDVDGTSYDVPLSERSKICSLRDVNKQKLYGYLKNMFIFEINGKKSISEDPDEEYESLYTQLKIFSAESNIFVGEILFGLTNGLLTNKQEVSFKMSNNDNYVIRLDDLYPFINEMSGGSSTIYKKMKRMYTKRKKTSRRKRKTYKRKSR